jgi:hypothetical protein
MSDRSPKVYVIVDRNSVREPLKMLINVATRSEGGVDVSIARSSPAADGRPLWSPGHA